jgi:hypothetical protein
MDLIIKNGREQYIYIYIYPHKLSKYPKIFIGTYWNMHSFDNFELNEVEQLIKNRDLLVETFNIKSCICSTKIPKYILKQTIIYNDNNINNNLNDYRDHIEYYKTQDGNILSIFSIYVSPEDNMINELYKNNGYKLFVPIYDKNQNTYFKLILK